MIGIGGGLRITKDKRNKLTGKGLQKGKPSVPMFGNGTPAQGTNQSFAPGANTNAGLVSTVAMTHT